MTVGYRRVLGGGAVTGRDETWQGEEDETCTLTITVGFFLFFYLFSFFLIFFFPCELSPGLFSLLYKCLAFCFVFFSFSCFRDVFSILIFRVHFLIFPCIPKRENPMR